jgi:hypothetical protein
MTSSDPLIPLLISFQERFNHITDEIIKTQKTDRESSRADYEKLEARMSQVISDLDKIKEHKPLEPQVLEINNSEAGSIKLKVLGLLIEPIFWVGVAIFMAILVIAQVDFNVLFSKLLDVSVKVNAHE